MNKIFCNNGSLHGMDKESQSGTQTRAGLKFSKAHLQWHHFLSSPFSKIPVAFQKNATNWAPGIHIDKSVRAHT